MLVFLFIVAAIYTSFPHTNAASDCSVCELNEYYNATNGYMCFHISNGQVACTCPDQRYTLDQPCRICERKNICGDDPNNLCAELSPTSFTDNNDSTAHFACFCTDTSFYIGEPCPSIPTTPITTTTLSVPISSTIVTTIGPLTRPTTTRTSTVVTTQTSTITTGTTRTSTVETTQTSTRTMGTTA
ncbi:unnamed protein product [Rotaria sp. Silwood1]|nr:unnamed protein product [Rotaria sp. Silwood1]